jgi:hypothetical protein
MTFDIATRFRFACCPILAQGHSSGGGGLQIRGSMFHHTLRGPRANTLALDRTVMPQRLGESSTLKEVPQSDRYRRRIVSSLRSG